MQVMTITMPFSRIQRLLNNAIRFILQPKQGQKPIQAGILPYPRYRFPILKQLFAYTQTVVRLYSNSKAIKMQGAQQGHSRGTVFANHAPVNYSDNQQIIHKRCRGVQFFAFSLFRENALQHTQWSQKVVVIPTGYLLSFIQATVQSFFFSSFLALLLQVFITKVLTLTI